MRMSAQNRREKSRLGSKKIDLCYTIVFLLLVSISACSTQATDSTTVDPVQSEASQQIATPTRSITALPGLKNPEITPLPSPFLHPSNDIPPLKFTFPTVVVEPITIWRPPLYSIPWEPTPYDHFYFSRPIGANEVNWPLANYRYGGTFYENVIHTGIDIPAPKGTPVMAAGSGTVIWAGYGLYFQKELASDPYGIAIAIKHNFGYQGQALYSVYGHLNSISVVRGQEVIDGQVIGAVGETGKVTGPHLHFEVRIGENNFFVTRNPELWLAPPQGWGILAARIMRTSGELLERQTVNIRSLDLNQYWSVNTYGSPGANSDPYYRENMVIGDLPAGNYVVSIKFEDGVYSHDIKILPGMVSYFRFIGTLGFDLRPPTPPITEFIPPDQDDNTAP
jgi:murein DD-endopeptidase MepM/ murein hydrolase activator NlpD